jgi:hypothetical protein
MARADREQFPKELYFPPAGTPVVVRVPRMKFLAVEGKGDPSTSAAFREAIGALYGTAYTMKFTFEKGHPLRAARIGPLEGLFWTGRRAGRFQMNTDARELNWKLMLVQPAEVTGRVVDAAVRRLRDRKNPPGLDGLSLESRAEGLAVQVMHLGPYAAEPPTIKRLLEHAAEQGYTVLGPHHEIYLSDPTRIRPDRLKTVIRYPVARAKRRRPAG